jgi:hypothetical protein
MSNEVAALHPALLIAGTAVIIDKAALFVTKSPFQRILNIVSSNIVTVFPNSPVFDPQIDLNDRHEIVIHDQEDSSRPLPRAPSANSQKHKRIISAD